MKLSSFYYIVLNQIVTETDAKQRTKLASLQSFVPTLADWDTISKKSVMTNPGSNIVATHSSRKISVIRQTKS